MRFGPLFRILGTLVYGFIGWELGVALARTRELNTESALYIVPAAILGAALGFILSPWIVIAPAKAARNSLRQVPMGDLVAGVIGLSVGLLIAALLAFPVSQLPPPFGSVMPFIGVIVFGYLGAAVLVLRQEDFFAILGLNRTTRPTYVTPAHNGSPQPLLMDTSVIIDGRIADVARTGFIPGTLTVPRFVLNELQYIADSPDALRRNRGRRGLEMLSRLQNSPEIAIEFIDEDPAD
ncbi:MAG TPA: PIN domain nuclease, partial [Caldilineaceae bacterium]|nr:PIN domain nuclease [Caldilineaceae bacterium]